MTEKKNIKNIIIILTIVLSLWLLSWFLITLNIEKTSERGTFGDMFGAINSLFSGMALVGIVYSIFLQVKSTYADHDRRKKEATINYLNQIRPKYKTLLKECEKSLGKDVISQETLESILTDEDLLNTVRDFLATLEHLSVGANTGVFDKDILFRMSANYLIRMHHRFKPYINNAQKNLPSAYIELGHLVNEFENRKTAVLTNEGTVKI